MARFPDHPRTARMRSECSRIALSRRAAVWPAIAALAAALWLGFAPVARAQSSAPGAPRYQSNGEPTNLYDLGGWLEFKRRGHLASLPAEARLFHRRALLAAESGQPDEAHRLMRGASELDPGFVAPHLVLAGWSVAREPSQALLQIATVLELAQRNFMLQLALAANSTYAALQAFFLGLLAAGMLIVVVRVHLLRHPWEERLGRWLSPETARWWSWSFVVLPYFAGLGPVLPTLAFLGLLWSNLRVRERILTVALAAAAVGTPGIATLLDRLAAPLDPARAPLHGVPMVEHEGWIPERQGRFAALAAQHPDNPFVHFAHAWTLRQSGDAVAAEAAYREAAKRWPADARTLNNLGNALAIQGRSDEALQHYLKATKLDPQNGAAWFNASQIYTQRFAYREANDALSHASAVDFEMVKSYQAQAADGTLALVDQWIAPRTFWSALAEAPVTSGRRSVPPAWRGRIEAIGWPFSAAVLLVTALGIAIGVWENRTTPLRTCSNCSRAVCRRCARRRRELALCPTCEGIEVSAESPDFARLMLNQHQRRALARERMLRTAGATLIPGFGLLARGRLVTPVLLLAATAALLGTRLGTRAPFAYEPHLLTTDSGLSLPVAAACWVLVFAWSLLGYFRIEARARAQAAQIAAPVRSRVTQATRQQQPPQAA